MPEDFQTYYWKEKIFNPEFLWEWSDFENPTLSLLDDYESFCTYLMISI
jgi:hypothetical protein